MDKPKNPNDPMEWPTPEGEECLTMYGIAFPPPSIADGPLSHAAKVAEYEKEAAEDAEHERREWHPDPPCFVGRHVRIGSILPWYAPEEIRLREETVDAYAIGIVEDHRHHGGILSARYSIGGPPLDMRRMFSAVEAALSVALRWNGGPAERGEEPARVDGAEVNVDRSDFLSRENEQDGEDDEG